jgi:hypothetical protein
MTVQELINELEKHPRQSIVYFTGEAVFSHHIHDVLRIQHPKTNEPTVVIFVKGPE